MLQIKELVSGKDKHSVPRALVSKITGLPYVEKAVGRPGLPLRNRQEGNGLGLPP